MNETIFLALELVLLLAQNNDYCMYDNCPEGVLRYNCQDFTKDAVLLLRENGYEAYPVLGRIFKESNGFRYGILHNWVRIRFTQIPTIVRNASASGIGVDENGLYIDVEPQTGGIVTHHPNYEFRRRGVVRGIY